MNDLTTNINQAVSDFNSIRQAIINKGVEVSQGTPTSEYSNLINAIQNSGNNEDGGMLISMCLYGHNLTDTIQEDNNV